MEILQNLFQYCLLDKLRRPLKTLWGEGGLWSLMWKYFSKLGPDGPGWKRRACLSLPQNVGQLLFCERRYTLAHYLHISYEFVLQFTKQSLFRGWISRIGLTCHFPHLFWSSLYGSYHLLKKHLENFWLGRLLVLWMTSVVNYNVSGMLPLIAAFFRHVFKIWAFLWKWLSIFWLQAGAETVETERILPS